MTLLVCWLIVTLMKNAKRDTAFATAEEFQNLLTEKARLRDFAELSSDWFWEQDAEFRFTHFSGTSPEKLERDPESFIGRRRWDMAISGVSIEQLDAHIATCERHEPFRDLEYDIRSTDGDLQRYSISGVPVFDRAGAFSGYRGTGRNITALHRARQAVYQHDRWLTQIVECSSVAIFVIDASHCVTHWNRACEVLTGLKAVDVIGTRDAWRGFYPSSRPTLSNLVLADADESELTRYYAAGHAASSLIPGAREAEMPFPGAAGSVRWLYFTAAPLFDARGDKIGALETLQDVTDRHRATDALASMLDEYTLIFENVLVGMAFMKDRVFLRCNSRLEQMFGYEPGGLTGHTSRILFSSEAEWSEIGRGFDKIASAGKNISQEVRYCRRDGMPIWARVNGRRIKQDEGEFWIWCFQDVTGQHRAEEELRRSYGELEQRVTERTAELSEQLHFMQELIEALPGPLFYKDRNGLYLGCNSAFADFVGKPHNEVIGCTVYDLASKSMADTYVVADEALYRSGGHQIYETRVRGADGEAHDVMFHKAVFCDKEGRIGGLVGVMLDISERIAMESQLRLSANVFDSTADGVAITDAEGKIVAINRAFVTITGYEETDVLGHSLRQWQAGRQTQAFYDAMWETIRHEGRWRGEIWSQRKDGIEFAEWLTISAVTDKNGTITHYVAVFSDVTPIKRAQERLEFQAHHDQLTGLPNRLLLEERLDKALHRVRRENTNLAVLFIDLDRFKTINDTLGHDVGDQVLCEVSRRFLGVVREADTVARIGGDEFVVLLEDVADTAAAARVAEKIIESARQSIILAGQEFFIGASVGISLFPADGETALVLLKNADAAMYRAKLRGRNVYEYATPDITEASLERFRLEVDIRQAIERNELSPFFQPQYSLATGRMVGAEALMRWHHPQHGMVSPAKFIPLAEESGLIVSLGAWILREACRCWAGLIARGLDPGILSVNVSGVEFRRGHVLQTVRSVLAESGLAPQCLSLEITESAIMHQADGSIRELCALRDLGVHLAVDDFGTGYSSLAYLKRLPISMLKIDQSFVRGLPDDGEDAAIARAVIALAHSLQLTTLAEGVETASQEAFLRDAGCDEMQGFLKARPVPVEEFEALIRKR